MVEQSGTPQGFDSQRWLANWIEQPLPALCGKKPADYLDTPSGVEMVSNLLRQIHFGIYS